MTGPGKPCPCCPAVVARPGDTLIVGMGDRRLAAPDADRLLRELEAHAPGLRVVPIESVTQLMVYRPDNAPEG